MRLRRAKALQRSGAILLVFFVLFASGIAAGQTQSGGTTCNSDGCHVSITIKIAFVGANDSFVDRCVDEIEKEWGGTPENPRYTGDCKCPFEVRVMTETPASCTQASAGYHCIQVTSYKDKPPFSANESVLERVKKGEIDPKTSDLVTRYRGYLYPPGTTTGPAITGWWSDIMSTPLNGQQTLDFAHEAGHLMGLGDGDGGIMNASGVIGPNAGVSQENIDAAVKNVCGADACPDRCCCGNAVVDSGKGEGCDPLATPSGCSGSTACCPVCCNCFGPTCDPENGEYPDADSCARECTEEGATCAYNFWTGCWDCVDRIYASYADEYSASKESIWKADESVFHDLHNRTVQATAGDIEKKVDHILDDPRAARILADERVILHLNGDVYGFTTMHGEMEGWQEGEIADPTVLVYTDEETLDEISAGSLSPAEAIESGRVRYEGAGPVDSLRLVFTTVLIGIEEIFSSFF